MGNTTWRGDWERAHSDGQKKQGRNLERRTISLAAAGCGHDIREGRKAEDGAMKAVDGDPRERIVGICLSQGVLASRRMYTGRATRVPW